MKNFYIILLIFVDVIFANFSDFRRVPVLDTNKNYYKSSFIIEEQGGLEKIYLFYNQLNKPGVFFTTNLNGIWSEPETILMSDKISLSISSLRLTASKMLLASSTNDTVEFKFTSNNGLSWVSLPKINLPNSASIKLLKLKDNQIGLLRNRIRYPYSEVYIYKSSNEGQSWSSSQLLLSNCISADLVLTETGEYLLFYLDHQNNSIKLKSSTDLISWSAEKEIVNSHYNIRNIKITKDSTDKLYLTYLVEYPVISSYFNLDILLMTSEDRGNSWTAPLRWTTYKGYDLEQQISTIRNDLAIMFLSTRLNGSYQFYYGYLSSSRDLNTPPIIYNTYLVPNPTPISFPTNIRVIADGTNPIERVTAYIRRSNNNYQSVVLSDDGLNNDSLPNDKIYGGRIPFNIQEADTIDFYSTVIDNKGNLHRSVDNRILIPLKVVHDIKELKNKFSFQITKNGYIGSTSNSSNYWGALYNSFLVIYSAGFLLSGYKDSNLWASSQFPSRYLYHFSPGIIGLSQIHPTVNLYVIESSEPAFNQSWQTYRFAVQNGAPFYDGDNNGVYNPVDKNGNGQWDNDEDAPEMIGDVSTWCVINDSYASLTASNYFYIPQNVEVQISTFSFNLGSQYEDQIFIRYRIINRKATTEVLDSVLFSFYVDPDIENHSNDYLGCDTILNLGYTYSGLELDLSNPPAIGVALLQGPPVYIPNKTFLDKNNDGVFTPNIDIPIDSAFFKYGSKIPTKIFPGAKNQAITSFFKKLAYNQYSPNNRQGYRFWQNSIHIDGKMTDPCDDPFGIVLGNVNCSQVNKKFLYSGDPYNRVGWINKYPEYDATFLLTTGPFKLVKDVPIDIWGVYVGGRGVDSLHSIVKLKENTLKAIDFYKNLPIVFDKPLLPKEYVLYQNYPNPFNSGTIIKWQMPQSGRTVIKIFDILGREVEKIVDNFYEVGEHSVIFNPQKSLASGVYFYQIKIDDYIQTKKMMLLK